MTPSTSSCRSVKGVRRLWILWTTRLSTSRLITAGYSPLSPNRRTRSTSPQSIVGLKLQLLTMASIILCHCLNISLLQARMPIKRWQHSHSTASIKRYQTLAWIWDLRASKKVTTPVKFSHRTYSSLTTQSLSRWGCKKKPTSKSLVSLSARFNLDVHFNSR